MKVHMDGRSLLGKRDEQQDFYLYRIDKEISLAVVCDGMGGLNGGSKASRLAAELLKEDTKQLNNHDNIPMFLREEARRLDDAVFSITDEKGNWLGAGTTIVAILIKGKELYWLTVGDSRIFIRRGLEMMPLNREHNYKLQLDELLRENRISREAYEYEGRKAESLISYLGMGNISIMDVNERPFILEAKDQILLCTDGVTKSLLEPEIRDIMMKFQTAQSVIAGILELIDRKQKSDQDNATFVAVTIGEDE